MENFAPSNRENELRVEKLYFLLDFAETSKAREKATKKKAYHSAPCSERWQTNGKPWSRQPGQNDKSNCDEKEKNCGRSNDWNGLSGRDTLKRADIKKFKQ